MNINLYRITSNNGKLFSWRARALDACSLAQIYHLVRLASC